MVILWFLILALVLVAVANSPWAAFQAAPMAEASR